jgi:hypothetical protein
MLNVASVQAATWKRSATKSCLWPLKGEAKAEHEGKSMKAAVDLQRQKE